MKYCFAMLAGCVLTACASAPAPPHTSALTMETGDFARLDSTALAPVPNDWWRLYEDPELDRLVAASLAANADLRVAYAHLDASRAMLRQARAARLPQTTIESGLAVDDTRNQPSAFAVPSTDWDLAVTASWDVDLFGRLRAEALAAAADIEAQQAALDGVRVAVVADTVQAYVELCGYTRALHVAGEVAARQQRYVDLIAKQLASGEVSPLELSQARTEAAALRSTLAPFDAQRSNALFRLAVLQGLPPADGRAFAITCEASPQLRAAAPVGDGTALLLRRPDIREADRRLAASAARVGVARADLYPRLNLGGALGLLSGDFASVATPLVSWSFPNQGPARARIAQARAIEQAALATWDRVVLNALRDVESSLASYDAELRRNRELMEAEDQAESYARRAAARVRLGDASRLLRVDAERRLGSTRLALVQSDLAVAQAEVGLFKALGGGWRTDASLR